MKGISAWVSLVGAAAVVGLMLGCAASKPQPGLMAAAGFKPTPATTPEQLAHLKTLPPDKVSRVSRDGKTYFVYPDAAHRVLYVGQDDQYQAYENLRRQKKLEDERMRAVQLNTQPGWGVWGGWNGLWP